MISILITSGNIFAQMSGSLPPLQTISPLQKPTSPNININTAESDQLVAMEFIKTLQSALNNRGFNAGVVDGVVGPQTIEAIRLAQGQLGLIANGQPSSDLLIRITKMGHSAPRLDIPRQVNWDSICSTVSPSQLSTMVSRYLSAKSTSRMHTFTAADSGNKLANPTVTWRVYISVDGGASSFVLVRSSGSQAYDTEVRYAVLDVLRCSKSSAAYLPFIEFTHSLY